ncbi:PREDICTED: putative GPI-anchored protein pfl2 [Amphimedon queenslandica]|uniref:Uncharacterized protein n=1 Tax=Amphimedon queenslandica TaxID=400682 RepID=A0AAN0JMK5_AMPQE|nr:PREDICTED: putative GPI-anchored protein pfl2 [Amphimedon queenslandica]|eukprot:XP_019858234.1 PREDICTED: putative GPI-anchored protein pfl2 [Amphimedon queenslandica]
MYYQQYNGPLNYELNSSNGSIPLEHNDYPLISVITKPIPSVTEASSSTVTEDINTVATMIMLSSSTTTTDIVMTPNSIPTSAKVIHHSTSLNYTTTLSLLLGIISLFPTNVISTSDTANTNALLSSVSANVLSSNVIGISASVISSSSIVPSSSSLIVTITPSPALSITESITTPLSSIESSHPLLSTGSISTTKVSRIQNTVSQGNPTSEVLVTSSSSSVTTTSLNSASMESTPDQSTGSLILAGSISSVFILLVVTILVILIVSVLVCRRKQLGTGYANGDNERITDEQKQDERLNVLSNISANAAYGVIGGNENDDVYSNPAYGINTIMTQSIDEELLVYDEPRTMYNEQEVIVMPAHNEAYTQQKEEEEDLYI